MKDKIYEILAKTHYDGMATENLRDIASMIEKKLQRHRPTIVCLCGSSRFHREFVEANYRETMEGKIVLSIGFYPHAVNEIHGEGVGVTDEQKIRLDELHLRKIDLADEVLILNVGGYIGDSTRRELAYARKHDKVIRSLIPL